MNYIIMLAGGLLGIFIYSLRKIKGIRKRTPGLGFKTAFITYWTSEWDTVTLSFAVVITGLFISKEYLGVQPDDPIPSTFGAIVQYKAAIYIRTISVVIGYCANSIVDAFLGTTEAKLQQKAKDGGANEN